jgi:hypothetical protein
MVWERGPRGSSCERPIRRQRPVQLDLKMFVSRPRPQRGKGGLPLIVPQG